MKHIKSLRLFESTQELNQEQIDFLNEFTSGSWEFNPNTGLVDIDGYFFKFSPGIQHYSFKGIKFGSVSGDFDCSDNSLTSLEGAPQKVGKNFSCYYNYITSLEGAPLEVGGDYICRSNSLTSLEGAPKEVGGDFNCQYNFLRSLEGAPQKIGGGFNCNESKLASLKGAPREVGKYFSVNINELSSLEGSPQKVGGSFYCENNKLTSLEGSPEEVGWDFACEQNPITSLKGAPQKIGGRFFCDSFILPKNKWNLNGWWEIFNIGNLEVKKLIATLPKFAEDLNKEIENNPGKWVMDLKGVWNSEEFRPLRDHLRVSDQFLKDIGDQSALSDLGF